MSSSKEHAASAPADAPEIFWSSKCGAYLRKHTATPTVMGLMPLVNERFIAAATTSWLTHHGRYPKIHSPRTTSCTSVRRAIPSLILSFSATTTPYDLQHLFSFFSFSNHTHNFCCCLVISVFIFFTKSADCRVYSRRVRKKYYRGVFKKFKLFTSSEKTKLTVMFSKENRIITF
jgi:hypothetical protein